MGAAMMAQVQSSTTANRKGSETDPTDPMLTPRNAHGVRRFVTPFQLVTGRLTPLTPDSTKRLLGGQYSASRHGIPVPHASGGNIGNLGSVGSVGSAGYSCDPWRMGGQMGLDRRSVSLGSSPVGWHRGGHRPQKITLCRKISIKHPIGKSC